MEGRYLLDEHATVDAAFGKDDVGVYHRHARPACGVTDADTRGQRIVHTRVERRRLVEIGLDIIDQDQGRTLAKTQALVVSGTVIVRVEILFAHGTLPWVSWLWPAV